jgi:N-formylglutamate deformylase
MTNLAFHIIAPIAPAIPLILDSPHSGTDMPADMRAVASEDALMSGCDLYVNELWSGATRVGATLLASHIHRSYIDLNRSKLDIDPELLSEPWPYAIAPSEKSQKGMGLIRRYALPEIPVYDRKLSVNEVVQRIQDYYDPYHAALKHQIDTLHALFGKVWHIDCHSMKSYGNAMNDDQGQLRPDFVVSDRMGTSADSRVTEWFADQLRAQGYSVKINDPYKGAELVRAYSDPLQHKHSLQIEINRRLYLNESDYSRSAGFPQLQASLQRFLCILAQYIQTQLKE